MLKNILLPYYTKLTALPHRKAVSCGLLALLLLGALLLFFLKPDNGKAFISVQNEIMLLADNIHKHYQVRPDYWGLSTETAIKNKLVPADLLRGDKIINSLGKEFIIGQDIEGNVVMPGSRQFIITIPNISKSVCLGLLALPLTQEQNLSLTAVSIKTADTVADFTWGGDLPLPISESTAQKYCKNHNTLSWIFE